MPRPKDYRKNDQTFYVGATPVVAHLKDYRKNDQTFYVGAPLAAPEEGLPAFGGPSVLWRTP
jgi:hypothetical protein